MPSGGNVVAGDRLADHLPGDAEALGHAGVCTDASKPAVLSNIKRLDQRASGGDHLSAAWISLRTSSCALSSTNTSLSILSAHAYSITVSMISRASASSSYADSRA